jgi:hypothetical protein
MQATMRRRAARLSGGRDEHRRRIEGDRERERGVREEVRKERKVEGCGSIPVFFLDLDLEKKRGGGLFSLFLFSLFSFSTLPARQTKGKKTISLPADHTA